jgi:hypothetical protein
MQRHRRKKFDWVRKVYSSPGVEYGILTLWQPVLRVVDPTELRLPSTRPSGADPIKLQRQIAKHGTSTSGMPALLAYEGSDGALELFAGVTRATRVAKLLPGMTVRVEVSGKLKRTKAKNRRVGDTL